MTTTPGGRMAVPPRSAPPLRLSYIIGTYPVLTETFIDREIGHLLDLGVDLEIVSIRRPRTELSVSQAALSRRVQYLLPVDWLQFALAHLGAVLRKPGTYFGTLAWLLSRPHGGAPRRRTAYHFATGVYLARVLRSRRGVHLHAHFVDRAATVALVAARLLGTTYSVTAHAREIYVDAFLLRERIGQAAFTATCTEYNRRYLERLVGPRVAKRLVRLYHGLDLSTYLDGPERTPSDDQPLLLAVAQLTERKGLRHLVNACRILAERNVRFRCEIVGDGPLREPLERQVLEAGVSDQVRLTGPLPYPEVVERYRYATAFVLPCIVAPDGDRDGIPNVILEAMAAAVPVISTPVSGIPEVLRDGETGLVVPEGDPAAIADAVQRLIGDPALGRRLGEEARAFVSSEFDLERNIARLVERFRDLTVMSPSGLASSEA
jgi:glycosyltransferase involved in cell wall biosynthesis